MQLKQSVRVLPHVTPKLGTRLGIKRNDVIAGGCYEHTPVIDDRRRFVGFNQIGAQRPGQRQFVDIAWRDLLQWAKARAVVCPAIHEPIARVRVHEPIIRDRRVGC